VGGRQIGYQLGSCEAGLILQASRDHQASTTANEAVRKGPREGLVALRVVGPAALAVVPLVGVPGPSALPGMECLVSDGTRHAARAPRRVDSNDVTLAGPAVSAARSRRADGTGHEPDLDGSLDAELGGELADRGYVKNKKV
jgi:hypothetical protein